MKIRVQVVIESDSCPPLIEEVAARERGVLRAEELGLRLEEAKGLLRAVQETMIAQQVEEYVDQQVRCSECGQPRPHKGKHEIVFRTPFGKLRLPSPRLYTCRCRRGARRSASPLAELLVERTAPELAYLEAMFAALVSYGLTVDLLTEVLPIGEHLGVAAVHRQVQRVAERVESELGEEQVQFIEGREDLKAGLKGSEIQRKLGRVVREFEGYIANNRGSIPNYGDRYRHGETISTAFVESAVNQVVSKRFVKKQQMRWSERGAHLLLQIRTRVLNDELRDTFCRWYPGLMPTQVEAEQKRAA
jgi:hypothetical protein